LHLADEFPEMGVLAPPSVGGTPIVLALEVPDAEAVFAQAVAAGAKVRQPLADMFWGDLHGQQLRHEPSDRRHRGTTRDPVALPSRATVITVLSGRLQKRGGRRRQLADATASAGTSQD